MLPIICEKPTIEFHPTTHKKKVGVSRLVPSSPAHARTKKTKEIAEEEAPLAAATEKAKKFIPV